MVSDAQAARRVCNLMGLWLGLDRKDKHAAAIPRWTLQRPFVECRQPTHRISVGFAERSTGRDPPYGDWGSIGCLEVLDAG